MKIEKLDEATIRWWYQRVRKELKSVDIRKFELETLIQQVVKSKGRAKRENRVQVLNMIRGKREKELANFLKDLCVLCK